MARYLPSVEEQSRALSGSMRWPRYVLDTLDLLSSLAIGLGVTGPWIPYAVGAVVRRSVDDSEK